jgi:ABC-type multidrug transport system ATPase subunit
VEPEAERAIQEAVDRLMRGRTTIISTDRLASIRGADLTCVLRDGTIVEQGTHAELKRLGGVYAAMATLPEPSELPGSERREAALPTVEQKVKELMFAAPRERELAWL